MKKRIFKGLLLILFIIGIIFIGNLSFNNIFIGNSVAEAINVIDTLEIIKDNNPINLALSKEINAYKEVVARQIIEERTKEIIAEREMKERAKEVERLISEYENKTTPSKPSKPSKITRPVRNDNLGKIAYLTFDDGPSITVTPQILEILDEYNIKATFFVIERMAEKYPEILRETYERGHSIGNHSYSHVYAHIYKNTRNFKEDINKSYRVLKEILGDDFSTNLFRFPGGSFGKSNAFIKAVEEEGYQYFDWNSLNGDAEGINLSEKRLFQRLKETTRNKDNLVILMHDTDAKTSTANSLRDILDYLIAEGYSFDVLDNYYND